MGKREAVKSITLEAMKRVAIVAKAGKPELGKILPELAEWLRRRGFEPVFDRVAGSYSDAAEVVSCPALPELDPLLVVVLGGDGTLLGAARSFAEKGTPILGVNLGFLGFLTEVRLTNLYAALEGWIAGQSEADVRAMLVGEIWRDCQQIGRYEALNELVVSKAEINRMCELSVELNQRPVARFRADGVIVSTPTGSTAYTLAANGPILTPDVDALVVTPICPHLLTLRPIVVPGNAQITVRVVGLARVGMLPVDGLPPVELRQGDELRCRRSEHTVNLVKSSESGFFEAMRAKLSWGEQ